MESSNKMRIQFTICGFHLQFADSTYSLRIPLAICGFHLQLRIPQQLNLTIQMSFVCGIQNSIEDQRKVAMWRFPRQI